MGQFDTSRVEKAAQLLVESHRLGARIQALPPELMPASEAAAYRVQDCVARSFPESCGWKVGLTSKAAQDAFKTNSPICGRIYRSHVFVSPCSIPSASYPMRGVEAEVACIIGEDFPSENRDLTVDEISACIARIAPAIEICESRSVDCDSVGLFGIIADNANAAALVTGRGVSARGIHLDRIQVSLQIGDQAPVRGDGSAVLGHPYRAIMWLQRHLSERGLRLRPGDLVATGSMTGFAEAGEAE